VHTDPVALGVSLGLVIRRTVPAMAATLAAFAAVQTVMPLWIRPRPAPSTTITVPFTADTPANHGIDSVSHMDIDKPGAWAVSAQGPRHLRPRRHEHSVRVGVDRHLPRPRPPLRLVDAPPPDLTRRSEGIEEHRQHHGAGSASIRPRRNRPMYQRCTDGHPLATPPSAGTVQPFSDA
jgi:hypothetical protein